MAQEDKTYWQCNTVQELKANAMLIRGTKQQIEHPRSQISWLNGGVIAFGNVEQLEVMMVQLDGGGLGTQADKSLASTYLCLT